MAKAVKKGKKKAKGYEMPEPLPAGLVLTDLAKKQWKIGPSIGTGGFGEIYSAMENSTSKSTNYPYVIKIEPHENGPLFVEMHFYLRVGKHADIENFKKTKKLSALGMPEYIAHGSTEYNNKKYRFLVIEKFGTDIHKLFVKNDNRFPAVTVFKMGIQLLNILEYIHSMGYIHGDVKGGNILLGLGRESTSQIYLVDFGMCTKFDKHYKADPKQAHNGTIDYLSRDAHCGVPSRRGDLEILGYNLTQWLGCTLPWLKDIPNVNKVQKSKETCMEDLTSFFNACFKNEKPPAALVKYFEYVVSLEYEADPDYNKLNKILLSGLTASGGTANSPLKFTEAKRELSPGKAKKAKVSPKRAGSPMDGDSDNEVVESKKAKRGKPKKVVEKEVLSPTHGYTAEMKRLREKIDSKKNGVGKVASTSNRSTRKREPINYNEKVLSKSNTSINVISGSDDEEVVTKSKKKK